MSVFKGSLALLGLMAIMIVALQQVVPHGDRTPTGAMRHAIAFADHRAELGRAGEVDRPEAGSSGQPTSPLEAMILRSGYPCDRVADAAPAPGAGAAFRITCVVGIGGNSVRSYLVDTYKGTATAL